MTPHRRIRLLAALLLVATVWASLVAAQPAAAARPNGAGLVVRHGDGTVVYVYVEFSEPSISGADLLARSGLALVTAPYGGLGEGVCSLDNEGCPASNCFCKSFQTPSFYWHYYRLSASGSWSGIAVGPSSRQIHDGDVDGWSWTADDSALPATSVDEIAKRNGVDRSASTATPEPIASGRASTPAAASIASPTAPVAQVATAAPTPASRAVAVNAAGQPTPVALETASNRGTARPSYLAFGAIVLLLGVVLIGVLVARARRRSP